MFPLVPFAIMGRMPVFSPMIDRSARPGNFLGPSLRERSGFRLGVLGGWLERQMIREALEKTGFNQTQAAGLLGLGERMLRYKLKKYGFK